MAKNKTKAARRAAAREDFRYVAQDAQSFGIVLLQHRLLQHCTPNHYSFRFDSFQHDYWPGTKNVWPAIGHVDRAPLLCDVLSAIVKHYRLARKDAAINGAVGVPSLKRASLPETSDRVYG